MWCDAFINKLQLLWLHQSNKSLLLHVSPAILDVFKNNFYYFSSIKHLQSSSFDQLNTFFHCVNQIQLKLFQRLIAINNVTTITCNHWYFINQLHSVLFHQLHTIFAVSSINCNHLFVINHRQSLLFSSSRSFMQVEATVVTSFTSIYSANLFRSTELWESNGWNFYCFCCMFKCLCISLSGIFRCITLLELL